MRVAAPAEPRLPRCVELDDETRVDGDGVLKLLGRLQHQYFAVGGSQAEESQSGNGKSELGHSLKEIGVPEQSGGACAL